MDYVDKSLYIRSVNGISDLMSKIHLSECTPSERSRYESGIDQFMTAIILILDNEIRRGETDLPPFPIIIHKPANS
jgi:hypothetical protein